MRTARVYDGDSRCIAARHQPALVLEYALAQGLDSHRLLRGTGLFAEDMSAGWISPQQFLRLLDNSARLLGSPDLSFLLGARMLPGHFGVISHALLQAENLETALQLLVRGQAVLSPLLAPRLLMGPRWCGLYWLEVCAAPEQQRFLVEMQHTAITAMCRWLSGERLPWQFYFQGPRPTYYEQHEVHLGEGLHFNAQVDALLIDRSCLQRPWPRGSGLSRQLMQLELEQSLGEVADSAWLPALYDHLLLSLRAAPALDDVAQAQGVSPATLKRRLQKHGSHFQAQLDLVRKHRALYLMQVKGWDNDAVADYLGFHDANNFRRSFKRWTGLTPQAARELDWMAAWA